MCELCTRTEQGMCSVFPFLSAWPSRDQMSRKGRSAPKAARKVDRGLRGGKRFTDTEGTGEESSTGLPSWRRSSEVSSSSTSWVIPRGSGSPASSSTSPAWCWEPGWGSLLCPQKWSSRDLALCAPRGRSWVPGGGRGAAPNGGGTLGLGVIVPLAGTDSAFLNALRGCRSDLGSRGRILGVEEAGGNFLFLHPTSPTPFSPSAHQRLLGRAWPRATAFSPRGKPEAKVRSPELRKPPRTPRP